MNAASLPASALLAARVRAWQAWCQPDPQAKCAATRRLAAWVGCESDASASQTTTSDPMASDPAISDQERLDFERALTDPPQRPGRPARPLLVHPRQVPDRGVGSEVGRVALLHAIAHIEFNAIDLALDAIWRFGDMPAPWVTDWVRVALDEARHFTMLHGELQRRGHDYGDFEAHDGLWEMALRTRHDVLLRVALVPRLLEARGLDVTPRIIERLRGAGDRRAIAILEVILREEVAHVAIGNAWFHRLCRERGLDPLLAWDELAVANAVASPAPPFNRPARMLAGFEESELQRWEGRARAARL
ncbi:MAG: ferritin-like domain-containing protein [Burkholderiales bacterium]